MYKKLWACNGKYYESLTQFHNLLLLINFCYCYNSSGLNKRQLETLKLRKKRVKDEFKKLQLLKYRLFTRKFTVFDYYDFIFYNTLFLIQKFFGHRS